jgi:thiamine biosynthesis lipoprotein
MKVLRDRVMGTDLMLVLPARQHAAVLEWLRTVERTFSRFDPGSDTSRVNAGGPVAVSELFLAALDEACRYLDATGGLFSPFLGAELARLGYDTDFALVGTPEVAPAPLPAQAPAVHIDHDHRTVTLSPGLAVDLGGFVKGWSVQRAAQTQREAGRVPYGMIDAGGDLAAGGRQALADRRRAPAARAAGRRAGAARRHGGGGHEQRRAAQLARPGRHVLHHIVDPRTGAPAGSDCAQATVMTGDLAAAEVYATCLVLLGTREGPQWLAGQDPDARWITVDRRVRSSVATA